MKDFMTWKEECQRLGQWHRWAVDVAVDPALCAEAGVTSGPCILMTVDGFPVLADTLAYPSSWTENAPFFFQVGDKLVGGEGTDALLRQRGRQRRPTDRLSW